MRLREGDVTWQETGDDIVVLDLAGSVYLRLNGSGKLLWNQLASSTSEDALVDSLASAYDIERDRAAADVAAFLADLRTRGLLVE